MLELITLNWRIKVKLRNLIVSLGLVLVLFTSAWAEKNENLLVNGDLSSPKIEKGMIAYANDSGDYWKFVSGHNPINSSGWVFQLHNATANTAEDAWKNQLVWRDGKGFEIKKGAQYEFQIWVMPGQEEYQIDVGLQKAYSWENLGLWFRVSNDTDKKWHIQAKPGEWTHLNFNFTATGDSDAPNLFIHQRSRGVMEIGGVILFEK